MIRKNNLIKKQPKITKTAKQNAEKIKKIPKKSSGKLLKVLS
jgi:hypothetical protein